VSHTPTDPGQFAEGEALYAESLAYWTKISQKSSLDLIVLYREWQALVCLARVRELQEKFAESARSWERAMAAGESLLPRLPSPDLGTMAESRSGLARALLRRGDHDRASRLLKANFQMVRRVPLEARTPSLEYWVGRTCDELLESRALRGMSDDEGWAREAFALLDTMPTVERQSAIEVAEAGYALQRWISARASSQRRSGALHESRRTTKGMQAFGRQLVAACPGSPAAHLALSEAFRQSAKDAFQNHDLGAAECNWQRALDEVRQAMRLDSRDSRARDRAADLEERLRKLLRARRA
jgi:tetratricopeptide (TPR) repeat protein